MHAVDTVHRDHDASIQQHWCWPSGHRLVDDTNSVQCSIHNVQITLILHHIHLFEGPRSISLILSHSLSFIPFHIIFQLTGDRVRSISFSIFFILWLMSHRKLTLCIRHYARLFRLKICHTVHCCCCCCFLVKFVTDRFICFNDHFSLQCGRYMKYGTTY